MYKEEMNYIDLRFQNWKWTTIFSSLKNVDIV